ncbi:hypothetical protein KAW38_03765 [Candidatus Micrarchaeota archaeon]|nr:hypothetical protein [Candidatus Micrarchaeota archaeon]
MSSSEQSAVELKGSRGEIYSKIRRNKKKKVFWIKVKPGVRLIVYLLNTTKVRKIIMSRGIASTVNQNVLDGLKNVVELEIVKSKKGRKNLLTKEKEKILKRKRRKKPGELKRILKEMGISRRTYYYWKKNITGHSK